MKKKDIKYLLRDISKVRLTLSHIEMKLPKECKHMWSYVYEYIEITENNLEEMLKK